MTLEQAPQMPDRLISCAEKFFPAPLDAALISICPKLDLVAAVTTSSQLDIFRLSGQKAAVVKRTNSNATIRSICWAPSGRVVRCEWSDDTVQENATSDGKCIFESSLAPNKSKTPSDESHLVWSEIMVRSGDVRDASIHLKQHRVQAQNPLAKLSVDDWVDVDGFEKGVLEDAEEGNRASRSVSNLPFELASMDIRAELPVLNTLPYVKDSSVNLTISPEAFTSQPVLDSLLKPETYTSYNASAFLASIRLICLPRGQIQFHMRSSRKPSGMLELGCAHDLAHCWVISHATNVYSTCSALLTVSSSTSTYPPRNSAGDEARVAIGVTIVSFTSLPTSGHFMELAFKASTSLQAISEYVIQTILCVRSAWTTCQDLPSRFLGNIIESLASSNELELVPSLYQLAVTGHCLPLMKEWLVDELGERGYKRWDTATTTGYVKIIELIHEHLLPALDHADVAASSFRWLCCVPDQSSMFNLDRKCPDQVIKTLNQLRLIAHIILQYAAEELRQFRAFSTWLSHQISLLGAEPGSAAAKDASVAAATVDYGLLLAYVIGPLTKSRLSLFLGLDSTQIRKCALIDNPTIADIKVCLAEHKRNAVQPIPGLHKANLVNLLLQGLCLQRVLPGDKMPLLQGLLHDTVILNVPLLEEGPSVCQDARMISEVSNQDDNMSTYVAVVLQSQINRLRVHRIVHEAILPASALERGPISRQIISLHLGKGEIKGVLFGDDDVVVVLFATRDDTSLLHFPYSVRAAHLNVGRIFPGGNASLLKNNWHKDSCRPEDDTLYDFSMSVDRAPHILMNFAHPNGIGEFVPEHLYVRYRRDKRIILLLDKERTRYRIYLVPTFEEGSLAWEEMDVDFEDWSRFANGV